MKTRLAAGALLMSATLFWAGSAQAKELSAFKVCGMSGCTSVTDRAALRSLIRGIEAQGDAVRARTPPPAPFLRLEYWVRGDRAGGPSFAQYYVPSRGVVALMTGPAAWTWVRPGAVGAVFDRLTRGVAPFGEPRLTAVTIGGKAARDPASYVRLFSLKGTAERFPDDPDWQGIAIQTDAPTPWSTSAAMLEYSQSTNVLWRGTEFVAVPSRVATRIEARRSLVGAGTREFPWVAFFGGIGAAGLILPAALVLRRRRVS